MNITELMLCNYVGVWWHSPTGVSYTQLLELKGNHPHKKSGSESVFFINVESIIVLIFELKLY